MDPLLFLFALALGAGAAIPIGPVQIETAKRAIAGHVRAALLVVAGSFTADVGYGMVALFGIAPVLEVPAVLATFSGVGAVLLWALAYRTWRESQKPHELDLQESALARRGWALATGFLLGASNPPLILSWLFGATIATRLGLHPVQTVTSKAVFVAGGSLGLAGYLATMTFLTHRVRHFLSLRAIASVYKWLAIAMLVLSLYFVHGVWEYFANAQAR